jgi:ATP-dependent Lhr-like helicase
LPLIARFLGGWQLDSLGRFSERPTEIIEAADSKSYAVKVFHGAEDFEARIREKIETNRNTLIFTNSRKSAETLTARINKGGQICYTHHGSLSKEIRLAVEESLKQGKLKAVAATSSLELGIDIGQIDEVVLYGTPFFLSSSVQKAGRAGHGVGKTTVLTIFAEGKRDLLNAVVTADCVRKKMSEPVRPVVNALDILVQVILGILCQGPMKTSELFSLVRCSFSYHDLGREAFDGVIEMLCGYCNDRPVPDLRQLLVYDKENDIVQLRPGAEKYLFLAGGTIPEKGLYEVRWQDRKIGELDEEFVHERRLGESIVLGAQVWRIEEITEKEVVVIPSRETNKVIPFWKADDIYRDPFYSEKISGLLKKAEATRKEDLEKMLEDLYPIDPRAAKDLADYLNMQRDAAGLPHFHRIIFEEVPHNTNPLLKKCVIHTMRGGQVNQPLSMMLERAALGSYGIDPEIRAVNDSIVMSLPVDADPKEVFVRAIDQDPVSAMTGLLENRGVFSAVFRDSAVRAFLVTKPFFGSRLPLWVLRRKAMHVLETALRLRNFPIVLETWRSLLKDFFDIEALEKFRNDWRTGAITTKDVSHQNPSPFCADLIYREKNEGIYEQPKSGTRSRENESLIRQIAGLETTFAKFSPELIEDFTARIQLRAQDDRLEEISVVYGLFCDRILVPMEEAVRFENVILSNQEDRLGKQFVRYEIPSCGSGGWAVRDSLEKCTKVFSLPFVLTEERRELPVAQNCDHEKAAEILCDFLDFYGPVPYSKLQRFFPMDETDLRQCLEILHEEESVLLDYFSTEAKEVEVCTARNLEILLRLWRTHRRASVPIRPVEQLPAWLFRRLDSKNLESAMEGLFHFPSEASLWEDAILPSRLPDYRGRELDETLAGTNLLWYGLEKNRVAFCLEEDLDLVQSPSQEPELLKNIFPQEISSREFFDMSRDSGFSSADFTQEFWKLVFQGFMTAKSWDPVRRGVENKFRAQAVSVLLERGNKSVYSRWKNARPSGQYWHRLPISDGGEIGTLDREEIYFRRIRLLLDRYGIIFKALLEHEGDDFKYGILYRALRRMELSGEIIGGVFFQGVDGLQFMRTADLEKFISYSPNKNISIINACDPLSLCGRNIAVLKKILPKRLRTTTLVWAGSELLFCVQKNGSAWRFEADFFHESLMGGLAQYLESRKEKLLIETINGEKSETSPWAPLLKEQFGFYMATKGLGWHPPIR